MCASRSHSTSARTQLLSELTDRRLEELAEMPSAGRRPRRPRRQEYADAVNISPTPRQIARGPTARNSARPQACRAARAKPQWPFSSVKISSLRRAVRRSRGQRHDRNARRREPRPWRRGGSTVAALERAPKAHAQEVGPAKAGTLVHRCSPCPMQALHERAIFLRVLALLSSCEALLLATTTLRWRR